MDGLVAGSLDGLGPGSFSLDGLVAVSIFFRDETLNPKPYNRRFHFFRWRGRARVDGGVGRWGLRGCQERRVARV